MCSPLSPIRFIQPKFYGESSSPRVARGRTTLTPERHNWRTSPAQLAKVRLLMPRDVIAWASRPVFVERKETP